MVLPDDSRGDHLLLHILGNVLLHEQFGDGAVGADGVDVEHILMAVHRVNQHLLRVARGQNARHVSIGIHRNLQLLRPTALDVVAPCGDLRVHLSSLRIFVGIKTGIGGILLTLRLHAPEHLQRILLHGTLVKPYPAQHGAIGIEAEGLVERELLLVHPVGYSIDHLVELPVLGDLHLGIVVQQFHDEDVAIAHESHLIAIGRPCGNLLRTILRQGFQLAAVHVVEVIVGSSRTSIDTPCVRLYEHTVAVGRHHIPVEVLDGGALRVVHIKQHPTLLPRLERVLHDALPVVTDAGILVGTLYGVDAI